VPLQTTKYAGSNVLPAGREGVEDLKGKPKPVCLGSVFNIAPPCVNTSKLIYQVNDGAVASISAIRDRGVPLLPDMFIIGGGGNASATYVYMSADGLSWARHDVGFGASEDVKVLGWNGSLLIAGGGVGSVTASHIATSPDGVTWTQRTSPFGNTAVVALVYGGGVWVAGDSTGQIATSPDGITWTLQTGGFTGAIKGLAWNGSLFVGLQSTAIRTSPDGITWSSATNAHGGSSMLDLTYADALGLFVIVGDSGKISTSPNGTAWTRRLNLGPSTSTFVTVAAGNGLVLAIDQNAGSVYTSLDGLQWTMTGNLGQGYSAGVANGLSYGNGKFLSAAPGIAAYAVMTPDGARADRIGGTLSFGTDRLNCSLYADGISTIGTYANTTDLEDDSLAPAPGSYKVCLGSGYFRLGSRAEGTITCDVTQGASSADRTAAQLFTQVVTRAGLSSSYWNAGDVTALDAAISAVLGFWTDQETTCNAVIDLVSASVGAWWAADAAGVFRIQQLAAPSGSPVVSFTEHDMVKALEQVPSNDAGAGIPTYQSVVRYAKNFTVQTSTDLAGAVSSASRARYGAEWLDATATDATVLTAHPLSVPIIEESLLTNVVDAATEATRRQTLRGVFRQWYQITVEMDDTNIALELGDVVSQTHPRFGLSGGRLLRVLGIQPDASNNTMVLSAWG
jgi:hypothetical protein